MRLSNPIFLKANGMKRFLRKHVHSIKETHMKSYKKYVLITVAVVLIFILSEVGGDFGILNSSVGAWNVSRNSQYGNSTIRVPSLSGNVSVYIDNHGVAHIRAPDLRNLFIAQGYFEASNRMFQMDLQAFMAMGELSKLVGKRAVNSDISMHYIGIPEYAISLSHYLEMNYPQYYGYLEDFTSGVNDYIKTVRSDPPIGFRLLGITPPFWNITFLMAWQEFMAWSLTTGATEPLMSALMYLELGYKNTTAIWPNYPYYTEKITVVPGNGSINGFGLSSQNISTSYFWNLNFYEAWYTGIKTSTLYHVEPLIRAALKNITDPYAQIVTDSMARSIGSNSWVVAGNRSSTGAPMLANDPHLTLYAPSLWIPMQLTAPGFNVTGWSLSGLPGILIGHTNSTSWGLTTPEGNSANEFLEILNGTHYLYNGHWYPLSYYNYTLMGKKYSIAFTNNGPIIGRQTNYAISLNWRNAMYSTDMVAEILLDQSSNYGEMLHALSYWGAPPQNFALVTNRDAGYITAGKYPYFNTTLPDGKTVKTIGSRSLMNGTSEKFEPAGNVPFEYLPQVKNPLPGYAFAPNQPTASLDYPFPFVGGFWASGGRAEIIYNFLKDHKTVSVSQMKALQSNITDYWASILTPLFLGILKNTTGNSTYQRAIDYLNNWNFSTDKNSIAETIYWYLVSFIYNMTFDKIYREHSLTGFPLPFPNSLIYLCKNSPSSFWFDHSFSEILKKAFSKDVAFLSAHLGNISKWRWGSVHRLEIFSLTGLSALSLGPFKIWGDTYTVSVGSVPLSLEVPEPYVTVGSSLREISVPATSTFLEVFPGGISGNPLNLYYSNQLQLWLNHDYYNFNNYREVYLYEYV